MFRPDELAVQIKAAKANYIITHKEIEKTAVEAAALCGVDKKFIYTMGHGQDTEEGLQSIEYVRSRPAERDLVDSNGWCVVVQ
ncbi:unnamed protein product [Phytophthora lilii]|uniref:Unnamed protein product n=1 Tax=Phytophthora lilii TaxID=2077276 RepID=A0A9W6WWQ7_9STRA|nr:unnamed protein product [Phytophthora lilii]